MRATMRRSTMLVVGPPLTVVGVGFVNLRSRMVQNDRLETEKRPSIVTVQVLGRVSCSGEPARGVKDRSVTGPSYEQLAALVAAQERIIARLQARIAERDARMAELERRLAASSRNSSRPPSSEGLDKP